MHFKKIIILFIFFLLNNCSSGNLMNKKKVQIINNNFKNKGFSLIYEKKLYDNKIVSREMSERSLIIFQNNLTINTQVKITNILNNKSVIASVGKKTDYPSFYNSVISPRVAKELNLNIEEPYIEIIEIGQNSLFIAKKAKTFDEEKKVANKAPVNNVSINDLNKIETKYNKKTINKSLFVIKIGDFYFKDTALLMIERIKKKTKIRNPRITKITDKKYRVYLGPFDNINALQKSFNDIEILKFENIEIIKK